MASFTALNIEADDQSDNKSDNAKEIHIEEALKLYQTALKLHSQGPEAFEATAVAYHNLFNSQVFQYPEINSEFFRLDENPELEHADHFTPLDAGIGIADAGDLDSSLPQILFLTYKNHAQFIVDCMKGGLRDPVRRYDGMQNGLFLRQAKTALAGFAHAIARDESDADLWRRVARVGSLLESRRIARYCLEAAVEVDDDPTIAEVDPAGLEEGFAGEQLKGELKVLEDEVALSHPIMSPYIRRKLAPALRKYMDPYPSLPINRLTLEPPKTLLNLTEVQQPKKAVDVTALSWISLGEALHSALLNPDGKSGSGININLPSGAMRSPRQIDSVLQDQSIISSTLVTHTSAVDTAQTIAEAQPTEEGIQVKTAPTTVPVRDAEVGVVLPSNKRSYPEAGLEETVEDDGGNQKRSKRIRNRDNTTDPVDPSIQFAQEFDKLEEADAHVFNVVGRCLEKLGVFDLGIAKESNGALFQQGPSDRTNEKSSLVRRDLRDILRTWDDSMASSFKNGNAAVILASSTSTNAGFAAFLEHSKTEPRKLGTRDMFNDVDGLAMFVQSVNDCCTPLQDAVFAWVENVLSSYWATLWPEELKACLVGVISFADLELFERMQFEMHSVQDKIDEVANPSTDGKESTEAVQRLKLLRELVQVFFELHLDVYSRIIATSSTVSLETRVTARERVGRWADYAAGIMTVRHRDPTDELSLRYVWSSVFYATMSDDVSREHKILCWSDLQELLEAAGDITIESPNNGVISEISVAAAVREVSKLTTMDFFFNLFNSDSLSPTAIIETLEPVLDPDSVCSSPKHGNKTSLVVTGDNKAQAVLRDVWRFLDAGSSSLRMLLWQRLREAYLDIGYKTKVFSCYLKCIEVIISDLHSKEYLESGDEARPHKLLKWIRTLDELLLQSLTLALNDANTSFEIIDGRHIQSTCSALAKLNRILHAAALFDDEIRIAALQLRPTPLCAAQGPFGQFNTKIKEMQVRAWSLQYALVKEAMAQNRDLFPQVDRSLADCLAAIHYMFGLRKYCKLSNKIFLKMMKIEILRFEDVGIWDDYFEQVVFDLYGIRFGIRRFSPEDHGCPNEPLDKRTVSTIVPYVMDIANDMSIKDLLKSEIKGTIEKMQQSIGTTKETPQMAHNFRVYTEFLKTSIRPFHLYQAFKGQVHVNSLPVVSKDSSLATHRWFFLLGMISLVKFRAQKRLSPGGTDDLRAAANFFWLQLQFNAGNWEAWYRLAQCFDYELEDAVMWSADTINGNRADLLNLQRSAIHCYILALSTATQHADDKPETADKMSGLFNDFAMRLYASSREPFSMEAFYVDDFERHFSGDSGMYKKPAHEEMTRIKLWKYALALYRKSLRIMPKQWMSHFMLGKILWKIFCRVQEEWGPEGQTMKPTQDEVLEAFIMAIKLVPRVKDPKSESILEPHYKIVSIVHKMVMRSMLPPQTAADLLQQQPYAIQKGAMVKVSTYNEWKPFVLESVRALCNADKQHWHHRMIARVINILYDEQEPHYLQAESARNEFQKSTFTKTMQIQVWKPEFERPGRHFVYMERYVRLMIKLLWVLNDKAGIEQLARRVRKKSSDFFRFEQVWQECCITYLRQIRRAANIPLGMDEVFKTVSHDEFEIFSTHLSTWILDPAVSHPALDALRETIEVKKLNHGLMKPMPIDDAINDNCALLYTEVTKTLPAPVSALQSGQMEYEPELRGTGTMSIEAVRDEHVSGTSVVPPAMADQPRTGKTGISRREVLRTAEQAINKSTESINNKFVGTSRAKDFIAFEGPDAASGTSNPVAGRETTAEAQGINELGQEGQEVEIRAKSEGSADIDGDSLDDTVDDESALSELGRSPSLCTKDVVGEVSGHGK